jgi:hypothetical protein
MWNMNSSSFPQKFSSHPAFVQNLQHIRQAPKRTLVGITIIVISGFLGGLVLHQQNAQQWAVQVTRDIAAGDRITSADLVAVQIPATFVTPEWQHDMKSVTNAFATHSLPAGALLTQHDFSTQQTSLIRLAVALDVSEFPVGVGVGDTVDLWRGSSDAGMAEKVATGVVVFALDRDTTPGKVIVTMGLNPDSGASVLGASNQLRVTMTG